jgi:hypothetical protein
MPEIHELPKVHPDAKAFIEQRGEGPNPEPMGNVLVGEPAHEAVKVPRQALVALGRETSFTRGATIGHGSELYHLPADRSGGDDEIEGALALGLHALWPPLRGERHDVLALAEGAAGRRDLHPVCHPQVPILPPLALPIAASPPSRWFRSHEHTASLIIEIGPLIHELEIGMRELRPGDGTRQLVELRHGRHAWRCVGLAVGVAVPRLGQEGADSAQRFAVLEIVLDQSGFPRRVARLFPVLAPDDALDARSVRLGPAATETTCYLLEAVRVSGKIDMRIDDREHVRKRGQSSIDAVLAPGSASHACDEGPFIVTVRVKARRVISRNDIEKAGAYFAFPFPIIRPERVPLDAFAIANNESNQISEAIFGITLHINIDAHWRGRKFGFTKHIDCSVANGECMQRVISPLERGIGAFAAASRPKSMRELSERENTLAGISLDRLFADATQKAQMVLPDGLVTAAVAERADAAMIIQSQLRWGFSALQALSVSKKIFRRR